MAGNGKKVKAGVHAHEDNMHKGKPKTAMPPSVMKNGGKNSKKGMTKGNKY